VLTIVMYHYVRDLVRSRYPGIKGRTVEEFDGQLAYLRRHYAICTIDDAIAGLRGERELPSNACLLTFDDGFIDHYVTVFPRLASQGLTGCFFPSAKPVERGVVLDVHKIHFILAVTVDPTALRRELLGLLAPYRADHDLPDDATLYRDHAIAGRFDPPEISFVKALLQRVLPSPIRATLVETLFARHVTTDERAFAAELYMNLPQLQHMVSEGMAIGGHGYDHVWLDLLSIDEQRDEIDRSKRFVAQVLGRVPERWTFAYQYGVYNADTVALLRMAGCAVALGTDVGVVRAGTDPYVVPRLDTNHLPRSADAPIADWTREAIS
jgi:peptidoglycan/xylan/chitin deacetylase (PgdA/CDA1 family)